MTILNSGSISTSRPGFLLAVAVHGVTDTQVGERHLLGLDGLGGLGRHQT